MLLYPLYLYDLCCIDHPSGPIGLWPGHRRSGRGHDVLAAREYLHQTLAFGRDVRYRTLVTLDARDRVGFPFAAGLPVARNPPDGLLLRRSIGIKPEAPAL